MYFGARSVDVDLLFCRRLLDDVASGFATESALRPGAALCDFVNSLIS